LLIVSLSSPFFLVDTGIVKADEWYIDGTLPEPAITGFILDGYDTSGINVTVNQSHFHFSNNYINQSLEHIDFFVPEELQDDFGYVTPCNPSLMVCQRGNAPDPIYGEWYLFHVLNDWTNEYSNRFYIETDYIFTYSMYDPDGDIPEGFNWFRINQEIRVNYSENNTGVGDLLNSIIDLGNGRSIRINVSATYNNLVLNYTYFYNDEITGQFEDSYLSYIPPESEYIKLTGSGLNVSIARNASVITMYSGGDYLR
jgi:hypothetical protein